MIYNYNLMAKVLARTYTYFVLQEYIRNKVVSIAGMLLCQQIYLNKAICVIVFVNIF